MTTEIEFDERMNEADSLWSGSQSCDEESIFSDLSSVAGGLEEEEDARQVVYVTMSHRKLDSTRDTLSLNAKSSSHTRATTESTLWSLFGDILEPQDEDFFVSDREGEDFQDATPGSATKKDDTDHVSDGDEYYANNKQETDDEDRAWFVQVTEKFHAFCQNDTSCGKEKVHFDLDITRRQEDEEVSSHFMTEEEASRYWYSDQELDQMQKHANQAIDALSSAARNAIVNDYKSCTKNSPYAPTTSNDDNLMGMRPVKDLQHRDTMQQLYAQEEDDVLGLEPILLRRHTRSEPHHIVCGYFLESIKAPPHSTTSSSSNHDDESSWSLAYRLSRSISRPHRYWAHEMGLALANALAITEQEESGMPKNSLHRDRGNSLHGAMSTRRHIILSDHDEDQDDEDDGWSIA
mmetsp:Transcript_9211/g.19119  ORF Transcript_9211/g.19119 Transcript_9211/m.19119 type:complete len:406 (-) Transcript_9211:1937-3154(-)|eukprot:CAMPEP_0172472242 /NCGR_PEP_ID=MMETSP1065-20121228/68235_1 /TAXON_ID=265537 /ORGANISM="Amphiprora paludosa, Strain CCMP125" /LENGTH=405 /DNA_ID=CAMNT_0013230373 /DNA_START=317 /DNA_END=1534 /DNA_ORIENTATION=-